MKFVIPHDVGAWVRDIVVSELVGYSIGPGWTNNQSRVPYIVVSKLVNYNIGPR